MDGELSGRFQEALNFAFELHRHQSRKVTGVPYLAHLMAVSGLVLEDGGSEEEAIAGLLHDAVEDQGGQQTLEQIRQRFGEQVAEIVLGCSDTDQIPKPPWQARKEAFLARMRQASPSVRRVSLADKVHNARDILFTYRQLGEAVWGRFRGGKEGTLWYYRSLVQIFCEQREDPLAEELKRVVAELEELGRQGHPR